MNKTTFLVNSNRLLELDARYRRKVDEINNYCGWSSEEKKKLAKEAFAEIEETIRKENGETHRKNCLLVISKTFIMQL